MNIKTLLLALSLSLLNWILVYFLIEEITFYKYLLIEAITAISTLVYEHEKKKIQPKGIFDGRYRTKTVVPKNKFTRKIKHKNNQN
jgi:hypothetical protein